jgi:ABC-type multidrug transport system fused ATPase/permease subunit
MFLFDARARRIKTQSYQKSNQIAEETFSGIRTISSFGKETVQINKFTESLAISKKIGIKAGPIKGDFIRI